MEALLELSKCVVLLHLLGPELVVFFENYPKFFFELGVLLLVFSTILPDSLLKLGILLPCCVAQLDDLLVELLHVDDVGLSDAVAILNQLEVMIDISEGQLKYP